MELRELLKLFQ